MTFKAQTQFLLIENVTEAPTEAYTTLGFSTARGNDKLIGQFGTGNKLAITHLLREDLKVFVYCGSIRVEFSTRCEEVKGQNCRHVTYKIGSRKPRDTGWTLEWGAIDWAHTAMALREFIANSIDRHVDLELDRPTITQVNDDQRRAKVGVTRVYVEMNDDVRRYFANLGDHFIHFSDHPERVLPGLLPKSSPGPARIYRMGVIVCEMDESEGCSLFDYNFANSELQIDESRNSNLYVARAACARRLRSANKESLSLFFRSLERGESTFESRLDTDYILSEWQTPDPKDVAEWSGAWTASTQGAIAVNNETTKGYVESKGHSTILIKDERHYKTLERLGVPTAKQVLSDIEVQGMTELPATPAALDAVNLAWVLVGEFTSREKPGVLCYDEKLKPDSTKLGFQSNIGVYLRHDISGEPSEQLDREALKHVLTWAAQGDYEKKQELMLDILLKTNVVETECD